MVSWGMVSDAFEALFTRLVTAFARHADARRRPVRLTEVAATHWQLHLARAAIAQERDRMTATRRARMIVRQSALSDDALARLRVTGIGFIG